MKIGLLLPSVYSSSKRFGEMIFAPRELAIDLADGLTARGHEVFYFASPDTVTKATLIAGDSDLLRDEMSEEKVKDIKVEKGKLISFYALKRNYEIDLTSRCYKMAMEGKLDIVHSYHDTMAHFFEDFTKVPTVYTLHDHLPESKNGLFYWLLDKFRNHSYVSISNSFRKHDHLRLNFIDTVYHGIQLQEFPFQDKQSDYLLFMGRLVPEKGLHEAIKVALRLNMQLEIGTHFPDKENQSEYFIKEIKPYLSNPLIGEPGMVTGSNKTLLYKQARAFLFPILWDEPFGMVMIEAMACGTPIVAYDRGSVPEVVVDKVTGFVVKQEAGVDGLTEAINKINAMSQEDYCIMRLACRKRVEENFTVKKMVEGYERVYKKVLGSNNNQLLYPVPST